MDLNDMRFLTLQPAKTRASYRTAAAAHTGLLRRCICCVGQNCTTSGELALFCGNFRNMCAAATA